MISFFDKPFVKELNNNWKFEYVVALLYVLFGFIGWYFSYTYSGICIVFTTIILLMVFNDFKYLLAAGLCIIFSYNGGYESTEFPVEIVSYAGCLIALIILYTIFNFKKESLKKPKSYIGIMILTMSCMLPIFWNNVITEEYKLMYFIYFSWLLYIVLYFIVGINIGKNSLRFLIFTFSFLSVLISLECVITMLKMHKENPTWNMLAFAYSLGWGICNEAAILICFFLPFAFYELIKSDDSIMSLAAVIKIMISIMGLFLTNSRGGQLFGILEIVILLVLTAIKSKKRWTNLVFLGLLMALGVLFIHLKFDLTRIIEILKNVNISEKLDDNGRFDLYQRAFNLWNKNWVNRIFGSGIVSEIEVRMSYGKLGTIFTVYHSTFFETLVFGGAIGILALMFHFYEKYKQLYKKDILFVFVMLTSYISVDIYGMFDNTYGMYYYMVPLVMIMAALDTDKSVELFINQPMDNEWFKYIY